MLLYTHIAHFVLYSFVAQNRVTASQPCQRNYLTNTTVFLISNGL